jgi:uncharacterized tellurite resistance protein B-like protein
MEQEHQLLKDYSDQEKAAYLGAVASIATADRQAGQEELEFLQVLTESAVLPNTQEQEVLQSAQDPSNARLTSQLNMLKGSELRFSLISDMISFAKADGHYTPQEEQKIQQVASYVGVDAQQFQALNQFVDHAAQATQKGQDITQSNFLESSGLGNSFQKAGIGSGGFLKGALAMMAPILMSRMMGRGGNTGGGGLLGGLLGGMGGGGLGGALGGALTGGRPSGGKMGGGLGSLFSMLSGGRGYGSQGGLGSVLGGLLGGGRQGSF